MKEKVEVHLWQDYLVFATLFGIADKVAKELKDIDPIAFGGGGKLRFRHIYYNSTPDNPHPMLLAELL